LLEQVEKFSNTKTGAADQRTKSAYREFAMLRNGKVGSLSRLGHDEMAANLSHGLPSAFAKALTASFPEMFA
jgi:hypothetical protein